MIEKKLEKPVLVLLCIAAALVVAIIAGTIYARVTGLISPRGRAAATAASSGAEEERGFLDAGRARIQLVPESGSESGAILVVRALIPYSASDGQFQEELLQKLPEIRDIIRGFFSLYTLSELQATPEQELKALLLERLNRLLVLGKPEEIYFEEFIFFE